MIKTYIVALAFLLLVSCMFTVGVLMAEAYYAMVSFAGGMVLVAEFITLLRDVLLHPQPHD